MADDAASVAFVEAIALPATSYQKDDKAASLPVPMPIGHDTISVIIDRSEFTDPDNVVKATAEYSIDGGKTWVLACGFFASGPLDLSPAPFGADPSITSFTVQYPHLQKETVLVRTTLEALKAITFAASLQTAIGPAFQPPEEPHSVVFDAVASANWANATSPFTWSHGGGTPSAIGIGAGSAAVSNAVTITALTYDGASAGSAVVSLSWTSVSTFPYRSSLYGLANPSAGTKTVSVTYANAGMYGGGGSISVTGSDTTTCFSNSASSTAGATGTAVSTNCTSATNELVMDHLFDGQSTTLPTVGGSQTSRWSTRNGGASQISSGSTQAGAATVTMAWTRNSLSVDDGYGHCVASFKLAGSGGSFNAGWASQSTRMISGGLYG